MRYLYIVRDTFAYTHLVRDVMRQVMTVVDQTRLASESVGYIYTTCLYHIFMFYGVRQVITVVDQTRLAWGPKAQAQASRLRRITCVSYWTITSSMCSQ